MGSLKNNSSLKALLESNAFRRVILDSNKVHNEYDDHDIMQSENESHPSCIYLDYNGTTPVDRRVFAAMIPYLTWHFGNPSSSHAYGAIPKRAISKARRSIMDLLRPNNTDQDFLDDAALQNSIIFTGCGTEGKKKGIYYHICAKSNDPISQ